MKSDRGEDFLIARGAPFHAMQARLGLLTERSLNSGRRSAVAVAIAAGVPLLLALATGGTGEFAAMATGPVFMTRFVLFIGISLLIERLVERRVLDFLGHFDRSALLTDRAKRDGAALVTRALALRNNGGAEAVCLALAVATCIAGIGMQTGSGATPPTWLARPGGDGLRLTPAGWWVSTVSAGLFWFLLFRWVWRVGVANWLLARIAGLEMRLVATHPDGSGGVGAIGAFPNSFATFVFAASCVVAASVQQQLADATLDVSTYGKVMTVWLALMLGVFSLPLLAFRTPLAALKDRTLDEADRLATERERRAERRLFGTNLIVPEAEAPPGEDPPDPAAFRKAAEKLSTIPVSRRALLPLSAAALSPLLVAGATQLPLLDLIKAARTLLIL